MLCRHYMKNAPSDEPAEFSTKAQPGRLHQTAASNSGLSLQCQELRTLERVGGRQKWASESQDTGKMAQG